MTCELWTGGAYCGAAGDVRAYVPGPRCPDHTPAALAGRPDHTPDPERTLDGLRAALGLAWTFRASDTALVDQRARDSGKRASGAQRRASHAS